MKKTSKIIEISGISGLIMLLFSIVCLFVGFVLFPGYLAMSLWNKASSGILGFPVLNIFQGVLLWVIVALGIYLARGAKSPIAFRTASQLDEREIVDDGFGLVKEHLENLVYNMNINYSYGSDDALADSIYAELLNIPVCLDRFLSTYQPKNGLI